MVMLVGMEWCFQGVVRIPEALVVWLRIDPRRWDKCRVLNLLLQFERLPSGLLVLNFRASGFLPNKRDRR